MNASHPLVAVLTAVLLAGLTRHANADAVIGFVYVPITPCRIVDTRVTGGAFAAKETRTFQTNAAAAQGGGACTVFSGNVVPAALSINVTVDATSLGSPTLYGFLSLTPTAGAGSSWMNFFGGQTIANAGVASINPLDGSFAIKTQNPTNVIVDVFGYYSTPPAKRVFVSSTSSPANFGGSAGADAICQGLANAAGLGGTYKAWISDSSTSAAKRLAASKTGYALVDGTPVANSWADLTDSSIGHMINLTESGNFVSSQVWTGTTAGGSYAGFACNDWSSANSAIVAFSGTTTSTDSSWSYYGTPNCSNSLPFYCFEQ